MPFFPTTPTNGQTLTLNGIAYTYNATRSHWVRSITSTISNAGTASSSGAITLNGNQNLGLGNTYTSASAALPWATVYSTNFVGRASSAQYADLAEKYTSDANYEPGTVLAINKRGDAELTKSREDNDNTVIGVVTTNPGYLLNSDLASEFVVAIALVGRVPCKVTGTVKKGQFLVSNGDGTARAEYNPSNYCVVGRALESFNGDTGTIEIFVTR
jgi:hypothetical protein